MSRRSVIVDERFCFGDETHLPLHKTSVFVPGGDGFVVYNSTGEIIFRVDLYGPESGSNDELVLMDSAGGSLVTLHRKKPSLHQRWEAFSGEKKEDDQEPIFSIFKSSIIGPFELVAVTYGDPGEEYHTEGSFSNGSCAISIYNITDHSSSGSRELVAEIKRKVDPNTNVVLGRDVFSLCIKPLIDGAFVMALVLVLDQFGGFNIDDSIANQVSALGDASS
ncbi:hypothetical protein M9H77_02098 [Catharanthus roseus]|uniref:Uncharacterized protein n=1 Tax=Catharanthus roseus TaxID=4058 RepID=A0ACC0C7I1_CATRO|nr:hypothetical protein M9H77_02098 [Catharanthus roseus]